jgi:hypothetical protein
VRTVTAPASASEHSCDRTAWHARCSATSADEHPVSTAAAGPSSPRVRAIRPDGAPAAPANTLPQFLRATGPAGKPAPHPQPGNGLAAALLDLAQPPANLTQISHDDLEVIAEYIFTNHFVNVH